MDANAKDNCLPLRSWIEYEEQQCRRHVREHTTPDEICRLQKSTLLRKTTVAYGIAKLLLHAALLSSESTPEAPTEECKVDNFAVLVSRNEHHPSWNDVRGVSMTSPSLSAHIAEPSFLSGMFDDSTDEDLHLGRCLEVTIAPPLPEINAGSDINIDHHHQSNGIDCRLFGILLYELYSGTSPFPAPLPDEVPQVRHLFEHNCGGTSSRDSTHGTNGAESRKKKSTVQYDKKKGKPHLVLQHKPYAPLQGLGLPSSVSGLVLNLMDGHESYTTLAAAGRDLYLALSDPARFLFDRRDTTTQGGHVPLLFREHKLYGREHEVALITDAFCRLSGGKNEAFFLSGCSGVGKTALVSSLTERVDISGGYVLTEKAEEMHKERPLMGVLSAFSNLCALIREKNSPVELHDVANDLRQEFQADFSVLARLLPKIAVLCPQLNSMADEKERSDQMNFQNVCFLLQRFMKVVSSARRPVVLFLDDCQWSGAPSLDLIHAILSDSRGANCFFFVGSFRDQEVDRDHPISSMMTNLDFSGVPMTKLTLEGLTTVDLNTMLSDAMGMFPRLCHSLSDIVFKKTKGNPYFLIEFLRSLVESRLLKYSLREKMWIWDSDKIGCEDVTDNVLCLLSRKMASYPRDIQLALQVLSCFGRALDGIVVEYLSLIAEYSDIRSRLEHLDSEGCVQKVGTSDFKFVHDKLREAAYDLIPYNEKSQFDYNLGVLLYSVSKGHDMKCEAVFLVADQLNYGIPNLIQKRMRMNAVELNLRAGSRAMYLSDYVTAKSYFNNALVLLPKNYWSGAYACSLRLFLLLSKAAYACGHPETACDSLKEILNEGRSLEDKLDAYFLYVTILGAQGRTEAWATCCEVLSQLNETVPEFVDIWSMGATMKQTGERLGRISLAGLRVQEMDSVFRNSLKFYQLLMFIAFGRDPSFCVFIACRMINLSLDHGLSKDSLLGFIQYAAISCYQSKEVHCIREAHRIAGDTILLLKRFGSSIDAEPPLRLFYYGYVAHHTEPWQVCVENLRKGFEVAMSTGDSKYGLYSSIILIKFAALCGENLQALLKEVDHHIGIVHRFHYTMLIPHLIAYRETLSTLIDKGHHTRSENNTEDPYEVVSTSGAIEVEKWKERLKESMFINRTLQAFWCGQVQRCHHFAMKGGEYQAGGQQSKLIISFYSALNSFRGIKNKNGNGSQFFKVKRTLKDALAILRPAAELCPWNFRNKVHLLEAEMCSFEKRNAEARISYVAAIASARASRFTHEQGLACELAGWHYTKIGDTETALTYLQQAKECYQRWGSQMKVESINTQIENISASLRRQRQELNIS